MLLTLSFPFPMFFPTYICQAKVMSQLIYHPQSSRARLVTTNNQPLLSRPPPHSPLQRRPPQSYLATKPAVILSGKLTAPTGGNVNFMQISSYLDPVSFIMKDFPQQQKQGNKWKGLKFPQAFFPYPQSNNFEIFNVAVIAIRRIKQTVEVHVLLLPTTYSFTLR